VTAAPDYVEPVVGWRVWAVVSRERRILLRSLFYDVLWYPGVAVEAACMRREPLRWLRRSKPPRVCPDEECGCGVHASRSPRRLLPYLETGGRDELWRVIGTVSLWGDVVECEKGWRAGTGYPAHLYVPDALCDSGRTMADPHAVAAELTAYGVPVELFSLHEQDVLAVGVG
jgi:hypothetical protein